MPPTRQALITGATRGIGRALVLELVARGATVFATGRDAKALATLRRETGCLGEAFDLRDPQQVLRLYQAARAALGAIDVLINNAGFNNRKALLAETTLEEFEEQYAVNLRAPYLLCREAVRDMGERGSGHIVNVISSVAKTRIKTMGIYSTMKYGLHGLTGVLIHEARERNVKVTAVYPGGVDTTFRPTPRPDYLRPESVAKVIADAIFAPADVVVHDLTFRPLVETNF